MLGKRSKQLGLLEADHLYLDYVGKGSFYGFLASMRGQLFETKISPISIARTTAGTACLPVWWPPRCCCKPTTK